MATLLDILNKTTDFFESKGIENPRLDAQLILGKVLKLERLELYLNYDRPLTEPELETCRAYVRRRSQREPLQHILGKVPFRNILLNVDKRALIPRPETELIVDQVKSACDVLKKETPQILEIGIGTGAIILSLKKEIPGANVQGVELSEEALSLAKENAQANDTNVENHFFLGDTFSPFPDNQSWDIIVSNPPYIGENEFATLQPEVKDWDPRTALIGGPVGTEYPARLIAESYSRLNKGGILILEIGSTQAETLMAEADKNPWMDAMVKKDYGDLNRFLWLRK